MGKICHTASFYCVLTKPSERRKVGCCVQLLLQCVHSSPQVSCDWWQVRMPVQTNHQWGGNFRLGESGGLWWACRRNERATEDGQMEAVAFGAGCYLLLFSHCTDGWAWTPGSEHLNGDLDQQQRDSPVLSGRGECTGYKMVCLKVLCWQHWLNAPLASAPLQSFFQFFLTGRGVICGLPDLCGSQDTLSR